MRLRLLLLVVLVSTTLVSPVRAETMYTCLGAPPDEPSGGVYAERRRFVESQGWWVPGAGQPDTKDSNHGHVHAGACLPERQTLDARLRPTVTLWVRVVLHDNPTASRDPDKFYASLVFKTPKQEQTVEKRSLVGLGPCAGTCSTWVRFTHELSSFEQTGLEEMRIRTFVPERPRTTAPTGPVQQNTSLNWQVRVVGTGRPPSDVTRQPYLRGKGWYTHSLYCEAAYLSVPVPSSPLSGVWSPQVQLDTHSSDESQPVSHVGAWVDPDFHASPPVEGRVLLDRAGTLPATRLRIDTTKLSNGVHRLHLRSDCRDGVMRSTNSGVLVVPFRVRN